MCTYKFQEQLALQTIADVINHHLLISRRRGYIRTRVIHSK